MKKLLNRFVSIVLALLFLCTNVYAFQLAELQTETATDLLLFFEEEDLIIATRHEIPVRKAPAIATIISAKEIRNMGARNLLDILRKVPGIGISIAPIPVAHSIEVRGIKTLNSEKILIMIDGHSLNEAMHSSSTLFFQYMSVEHIKRVEIIRGPGSALYGANAFLAVINIITKDTEDINGLQITSGGGSFNTKHYNLLFGYKGEKLKIAGHFDYLDTDGPSSFIEQDAVLNSGDTIMWQERPDIGLSISYGDFTLRGGYLKNKMGPYIGAANALNDESAQDWGQYYADLILEKDLTGSLDIVTRLYFDQVILDPYWELFSEGHQIGPYTYPDGLLGNPASKHRRIGGEITTNYSISDHLLTTGILYENTDQYYIKSIGNFNPITYAPLGSNQEIASFNREVKRDIWALYVQDVWDITDDISLTTGVRYDNYSDFGGTTNPRAGLVWNFIKNTSFKLLYGSAFRAPSFAELYHANNPSLVGNEDLKPEKIKTYEMGLEHRFLGKYMARLNYFYNDITDLIVSGVQPAPGPAVYENRDSAEIDGIEFELLADFGNDNYGFINYSFQDPRDGVTDERLADVPSHKANAVINLAPWQYLNTNVSFSWIGERPRTDGDTRDDVSSDILVDLTLIAKNFYRTLEIRGSVYNLFDEDYRDPSPSLKVPNDFPTNERMVMIEARYKF